MKCKRCKRELPDNSIYCNWCGYKQITDSTEVRVPPPKLRSGKWGAQVMVDGERMYVSGRTEEEYYKTARMVKSGAVEIKKAPPKVTLGEAIDTFLKERSEVISPSTLNNYNSYRKTRFKAYMDKDIHTINYQKMVNEECGLGLSPKTIRNAWSLVSSSIEHAGVTKPTIKLPQKTKPKKNWLDYQQIQTFVQAAHGTANELGALLALNGLRKSEILHLTRDDIDIEKGLIYVRGASVVGPGNKLVDKKANKNLSSTRTVHIVIPRIKELVKDKEGLLYKTNPSNLYDSINVICRKNGLPETGVHGLRHSFASLAYHLKWSQATVMREGGWSNPDTVMKIYTHLASEDANKDIKKMERFFQKI